jgi:hypothetical protein
MIHRMEGEESRMFVLNAATSSRCSAVRQRARSRRVRSRTKMPAPTK